MDEISYNDFAKLDIRIGQVLKAERLEGSDKLIKCLVDFGTEQRTIVSGLFPYIKPEELEGKKFPYVVNLKPREIFGVLSEGMILAISGDEGPVLLEPSDDVSPGSKIS